MRLFTFLLVALLSFSSFAATNVKAGDTVQEDGVLLTKEEAAKVLAGKEAAEKKCKEDVFWAKTNTELRKDLEINNLKTDLKAEKAKAKATEKLNEREITRLLKELEAREQDKSHALVAAGIGVAVTAVVTTAIFFAAVQIVKME